MIADNIKKNSNDISFVDTIGSFINNIEFSNGFKHYKAQNDDKYSYIWKSLSSIGEEYCETIYENVLNYIDNVSNVDLCKVNALQSMIRILGVNYDVLDSYSKFPVELANLVDIFSINRSYLLNSNKFKKQFIQQLYDSGCIVSSEVSCGLSDEIIDRTYDTEGVSCLSDYTHNPYYIDDDTYKNFLISTFKQLMYHFVYLKYADGEQGLSTQNEYIYEYIKDDLIDEKNDSSSYDMTQHDKDIQKIKIKYNIGKNFNQQQIVDDIENGYDDINNYNQYEQEILNYEINYRNATYSYNKTYLEQEKSIGINITRYSYYREKKVREYFRFIENTYSNLLTEENIQKYLTDTEVAITVYDKDINYFNIEQLEKIQLLEYDSEEGVVEINGSYIDKIAELLAKQSLEISEIREHLKIQMQKNYLKGTFLLISYMVNEFLKYNISNKYGDQFYTEEDVSLKTIMDKSISEGDNVELIEYFDDTEYYNITTPNDDIAKNGSTANEKFWENEFNRIGVDTKDIPLEELDEFYKKQMKLERNQVTNIANFLSAVFEYGVNTSFINDGPDNENFGHGTQHGDFTCQLRDGKFIGDPYKAIERIDQNIMSVNMIHDDMQKYIEDPDDPFKIPEDIIEVQLHDYMNFLSVYYNNKIRSANAELVNGIYNEFEEISSNLVSYLMSTYAISSQYEEMKENKKYKPYYFKTFKELTQAYLKQKLTNFKLSVEQGFDWRFKELDLDLQQYLRQYNILSVHLYNDLFQLSVWPTEPVEYWPYYMPKYEDELTSVTGELADYLNTQVDVNKSGAETHINNHYEKLNGYRSDMNVVLQMCIDAENKLLAFKSGVESGTGISLTASVGHTWTVWDQPMYRIKVNVKIITNPDGSQYVIYSQEQEKNVFAWTYKEDYVYSGGIEEGYTIEQQLEAIKDRCNYYKYSVTVLKEGLAGVDGTFEHEGFYPCTTVEDKKISVKKWDGEKLVSEPEVYKYPIYRKLEKKLYAAEEESKTFLWKEHYSEVVHEDILNSYDTAIENLKEKVKLINSELECIGFAPVDQEIDIEQTTRENVHEYTSIVFQALASRITELDDYVLNENKWKELVDDLQLQTYNERLKRIQEITLSVPVEYNIRYIDTEYSKLDRNVQDLFIKYKDYFGTKTIPKVDRLDNQIRDISNFMIDHDSQCSSEVYEQIIDLIKQHDELTEEIVEYGRTMKRVEISSINLDTYAYNKQYIDYVFHKDLSSYADANLLGDYIDEPPKLSAYGMLPWVGNAYGQLEDSITRQIEVTIPRLSAYQKSMEYANLAYDKYLNPYLSSEEPMTQQLQYVIELYEIEKAYISSQIDVYNQNHEIFLKYSGMDIGYDPFYNHKNQAYSSYQVHPYLYNFVEGSNLLYPLSKAFYVSFSEKYEEELIKNGIDNIIGRYGNVINLWKNGMYDWTGYKSKYESTTNTLESNSNYYYGNVNYTGLFYPPALEEYLNNTQEFIQNVQDDNENSYYKHLKLTKYEIEKIVNQLVEYEDAIRDVAQRQKDESIKPSLANEYDIYKYCQDDNGNSLILLKSYKHLYKANKENNDYVPSFNEKKNAPGELWMRIRNHPIAFPAFDVRSGSQDISQYNIVKKPNSKGAVLNTWIKEINEHFSKSDGEVRELTMDCVGHTSPSSEKQYLRCFFDMEIDNTLNALLLNVSYPTGTHSLKYSKGFKHMITFSYANSSVVIGKLITEYDLNNNKHVYSFTRDYSESGYMDNIKNPGMIASDNGYDIYTTNLNYSVKYDFIGLHNNVYYTYALFIKKYIQTDSFITTNRYDKMTIQINYSYYCYGTSLKSGTEYISGVKYDVFTNKKIDDVGKTNRYNASDYKYANVIASTAGSDKITVAFVSSRVQNEKYDNNVSVVNYIEYSNMIEKHSDVSAYGQNVAYPRNTALIQTDDAEHINIYNSFDSFTQYVITLDLKFNGQKLQHRGTKYYNLHTDMGFLPVYADRCGTTRFSENKTLNKKKEYKIELLGPEQTDVAFTPVIVTPTGDTVPYGRVTEDYKAQEILPAILSDNLIIPAGAEFVDYEWHISSFIDTSSYVDLAESGQIFKYNYKLTNTNYENLPILKGVLSSKNETENYYFGKELYDVLSGEDIIGPNNITYQNVNMTNHINNISAIHTTVNYDSIEGYPYSITMRCYIREPMEEEKFIRANTFRMILYHKNTLNSYKFYHIIQNLDTEREERYLTQDEVYNINFDKIHEDLSSYTISSLNSKGQLTYKKPFWNYTGLSTYSQMSAMANFKYSEEDKIDQEFPYLINTSIDDDVILLDNKEQYTFFIQFDKMNSLSVQPFKYKKWIRNDSQGKPIYIDQYVDINQNKYREFFDKTFKLQVTYNLEKNEYTKNHEIILYFNYKNYTSPSYVKKINDNDPPDYQTCQSTDKELVPTYLRLEPGKSGQLDLRYDFVYYGIDDPKDIEFKILGKETKIFKTYYVINVSDSKPKFVISRVPFQSDKMIIEDDTYETLEQYEKGTFFRYFRIKINTNRGGNYLSFSKIAFYNQTDDCEFVFPSGTESTSCKNINVIIGHEPNRLIENDLNTYFIGTWKDGHIGFTQPVVITFDMKKKCLDVEKFNIFRWYNSPNSRSHGNFMPKNFQIDFSNDNIMWFKGNSYNDMQQQLPIENSILAYGRPGKKVGTFDEGQIIIDI